MAKRRLLLFLLLAAMLLGTAGVCQAAGKPGMLDGFLGIPWGASPDEVLRIMGERPEMRREPTQGVYYLGPFGEWEDCCFDFEFTEEGLVRGMVIVFSDDSQWTMRRLKTLLANQFGQSDLYQMEGPNGAWCSIDMGPIPRDQHIRVYFTNKTMYYRGKKHFFLFEPIPSKPKT